MLAIGNQLITEMARDEALSGRIRDDYDVDAIAEWMACRGKVKNLAQLYVGAIRKYRGAMGEMIRDSRQGTPRPRRS